jgi:hypothetical protein
VGRGVKFIYYLKKFYIGWDIRHRLTIMGKADIALGVDHAVKRHASQLEQVDFLAVGAGNRMVRIGQANKGDAFVLPVLVEDRSRIRSYSQDLRAATGELAISISQARQLRAAVRSHKSTQEGKNYWPTAKIG